MPRDVIEAHVRRLPRFDPEPWAAQDASADELAAGLLAGGVAGPATHPLDNVRRNIQMLLDHDPDKEFGMSGLQDGMTFERVLQLVETSAGVTIDREARYGQVEIRPEPILGACAAAARRLRTARERHERVVVATGHPVGLAYLYRELSRWLGDGGAEVITPAVGERWRDSRLDHDWHVDAWDGVLMLTDGREPRHTHWPDAMRRILGAEIPDLVVGDHGFAGAAIEAGVDAVSIADVNDPALLVAKDQGRTGDVIVFDDHVDPNAYWPVFLALTAS